MEREKISEWIVRYNEGTLEGKELEAFLRMLQDDPDLRKEVAVDLEINRILEERDLLEFREAILNARKSPKSGRPRWFLLAATLLLLVSAGGYLLYQAFFRSDVQDHQGRITAAKQDTTMQGKMNAPGEKTVKTDSNAREPGTIRKTDLLAQNFVPLPSLESLVGVVTRADGIILEEPGYNLRIRQGDPVRFRWTTSGPDRIGIQVFDNRGFKILSEGNIGNNEYLLKTGSMKPGLYYWKILKNDQLVTVGKIRID
jgi:hypothetical protein